MVPIGFCGKVIAEPTQVIEIGVRRARVIVAFSFGSGANEEVARAHNEEGLEIRLKTVEEILKET